MVECVCGRRCQSYRIYSRRGVAPAEITSAGGGGSKLAAMATAAAPAAGSSSDSDSEEDVLLFTLSANKERSTPRAACLGAHAEASQASPRTQETVAVKFLKDQKRKKRQRATRWLTEKRVKKQKLINYQKLKHHCMHDLSAAKRLVVDRRRSGLLVRGEEHAEQADEATHLPGSR